VNRIHSFITALSVVWLAGFCVLAFRLATHLHEWHALANRAEEVGSQLTLQSGEIASAVRAMGASSREMTFLQSLVNVLPQEKGFVRTQKAMTEEVSVLRSKVGRKLRNELHLLVDTKANKVYVKKGLNLLWSADCSVGRGGQLKDPVTGRRWEFVTPRGQFEVLNKIEKPLWTKPDWAFVENGEPVPPPQDPKRRVEGELGGYVLNLGDGYLIHGTKNEQLLGRPVSHGCVRLSAVDLQKVYELVPRGTRVYIY
jgi:L,D-transpeptidase YbiS